MVSISLCMIVKNEEDVLGRCLACAQKFADEIIVADTGSTDKTKEIAKAFTEHVYDFTWVDDFSAARNFSFSEASMDYCMWLDADDILFDEDIEKLLTLKKTLNPSTDVVKMKYNTAYDDNGNPTFSYYRERLLRREAGYRWAGAVHEAIAATGNVLFSDIAVSHKKLRHSDPQRNLRIYERQLEKGLALSPRDQFYYARELTYHGRDDEAITVLCQFLDEKNGWVENSIEACRVLAQCYGRKQLPDRALQSLFRSFVFDSPRAEICCDIGNHFMEQTAYQQAIFWYETALGCIKNEESGAFINPDSYDYLPALQLCVCYYRTGDIQKSNYYNELAGKVKPRSKTYLDNKVFFEKLLHAQ